MRWALLDANPTREDFTLRQVARALKKQGHEAAAMRVFDGSRLKDPSEVSRILQGFAPDRILWCSITGLAYTEIWMEEPWTNVPKIILWFDDPVMPVDRYGLGNTMKLTARTPNFFHGIWDGYWREQARMRWGVRGHAIHLSADEEEYSPEARSMVDVRRSTQEVVFIGMLHSAKDIVQRISSLPRGLGALAATVRMWLRDFGKSSDEGGAMHGVGAWDLMWKEALRAVQPKERVLCEAEAGRDPLAVWRLRWALWAMAKNAVRVNILRQALQVAPLRVFCEQKQLEHASETEWRALLGEPGDRLRIVDTSDLKAEELGALYHHGALHLQATDPQSVWGGIPYRVFQCAASGRALLTDLRPELESAFAVGGEVLGYRGGADFIPVLEAALADPERLQQVGKAGRERFEREHTWRHRLESIEQWIREG